MKWSLRQFARGAAGGALVAAGLLCCCAGCNGSAKRDEPKQSDAAKASLFLGDKGDKRAPKSEIDPTKVAEREDIVSINMFWQPWPWLSDSESKVVGFRVPVYFVSGETSKGAFVPGRILAWVSTVDRGADGKKRATPVHTWEFTHEQAMGFRVRKVAITGYYYGFMLAWPDDVDLSGKEVEIEFGYERSNGTVITSGGRRFRVPLTGETAAQQSLEAKRSRPSEPAPAAGAAPTSRPSASPARPRPKSGSAGQASPQRVDR